MHVVRHVKRALPRQNPSPLADRLIFRQILPKLRVRRFVEFFMGMTMKALLLSAIQMFALSAFANDRTLSKAKFCDKYKGNVLSYLGELYFLKKEGTN